MTKLNISEFLTDTKNKKVSNNKTTKKEATLFNPELIEGTQKIVLSAIQIDEDIEKLKEQFRKEGITDGAMINAYHSQAVLNVAIKEYKKLFGNISPEGIQALSKCIKNGKKSEIDKYEIAEIKGTPVEQYVKNWSDNRAKLRNAILDTGEKPKKKKATTNYHANYFSKVDSDKSVDEKFKAELTALYNKFKINIDKPIKK